MESPSVDLDGSLSRNNKSSELEGALNSDPDEVEAAASGSPLAGPASPLGDLVSVCFPSYFQFYK